ncbi:MAG: MASE1 domain-containing protein [Pseudomonadota bacterium]
MEHAKWEEPVRGAIFGVIFCLAYLAGWFNSLDQWYLPAGLRVAALLLLPYRYWPYLLAGDCAAMLLLRVPRIPVDSATWAYASSVLLPLVVALPIFGIRTRLKTRAEQAKWLPVIAICMAAWASLGNSLVNAMLDGPLSGTTLEFFYRRCVGQYLAILAITLPALLWASRTDAIPQPKHFLRDSLLSFLAIAATFGSIVLPRSIGDNLRIGLMMLMLIPAIFLTFRHGWRGAAIGITLCSFAIAKTLYAFNAEGAYDAPVFLVQHTLVIASCGLLALGYAISSQYATARSLGISESEALHASRTSFLVAERMLREKALTLGQMQQRIDQERKRVVEHLKAIGDLHGALLLNNEAVEHNSRFGAHITDIYPLMLDQHGLNAALNSQEFVDARGGGAHILPLLGPNPSQLSLELQQAAYRCAGNAIDVLSELQPRAYVVKTRVRTSRRRRGIAVIVTVRDPGERQSTPRSANAAIELTARVKAHGGIVKRRHAHRISLWLSEPDEPRANDQ